MPELSEDEQKFMNAVCKHSGGCDLWELMERTGFSYKQVEEISMDLIGKGVQVGATALKDGQFIHLYLSPYDENYNHFIKK